MPMSASAKRSFPRCARYVAPVRKVVIAILAVAATITAGCTRSTPAPAGQPSAVPAKTAELRAIGSGVVGAAIGSEKPDTPYVFALRAVCTSGRPIKIKSVHAYEASHARVVAWGTRVRTPHSPYTLSGDKDGAPGRPQDNPGYGHNPVTVRCGTPPSRAVNDFAVGIVFTGQRGTLQGVRISYGHGQSVRSQYAIALCAKKACARAG